MIASATGSGDPDDEVVKTSDGAEGTPETTATAKATDTPKPTATATPTPTFEQRLEKSYRDNRGFASRASAEGLKISWRPEIGLVRLDVYPSAVLSEGDSLTIAAQSGLVASRAIWTTYPEVRGIQVSVWVDFTDQFGATKKEIAAATLVDRPTGERFSYEGLKVLVLDDNKAFFCVADHYFIHIAVYRELKDRGCLTGAGKDAGPMILEAP